MTFLENQGQLMAILRFFVCVGEEYRAQKQKEWEKWLWMEAQMRLFVVLSFYVANV